MKGISFEVYDRKGEEKGKPFDWYEITKNEDWAKGLIYCDIDGFYLNEDGSLVVIDDCGNARWCPADRFEVVFNLEEHDREVAREILSEIRYMKDGQFGEIYERNLQDIAEKYGIKRKV